MGTAISSQPIRSDLRLSFSLVDAVTQQTLWFQVRGRRGLFINRRGKSDEKKTHTHTPWVLCILKGQFTTQSKWHPFISHPLRWRSFWGPHNHSGVSERVKLELRLRHTQWQYSGNLQGTCGAEGEEQTITITQYIWLNHSLQPSRGTT